MNQSKNPFTLEPINQKEQFFGREREIRQVLNFLHNEQSISIVGPAKIGKTSFSLYIAHPLVRGRQKRAEEHIFVYFDCHSLANLDQGQCYLYIREKALHQIKNTVSVESVVATQLEQAVREVGGETQHFGLRTLFHAAQVNALKLVMILDNFELLAQNLNLKDEFFSALRSLPTNYQMAYLVTSQYPLDMLERICPKASPFFNIFQSINLGSLTREESHNLIVSLLKRTHIEFPEFILEHILELGWNEPYRLQKAGYVAVEMWKENGGTLNSEHCAEINQRFEAFEGT